MQIDWFTFAAQVVNFLVLVALLKHFLYGPILDAMGKREQKIAGRLEEAAERRAEAEKEAESYRRRNEEFDRQREDLFAQSRQEMEAARKDRMKTVRAEVDQVREEWYDAVRREREFFLRAFRVRAGEQVFSIARRALKKLADVDLESRMIDVFLGHLRSMEEEKREAVAAAIRQSTQPVLVRSAFEIPEEGRRQVVHVFQDSLVGGGEVTFETEPDLICGIELTARGQKIAWGIEDYLASLEENFADLLDAGTRSESGHTPKSIGAGP